MKNVIVIDNFYKKPYEVRKYALEKCRYLSNAEVPEEFPGTESVQSIFNQDIVQRIENAIGEKVLVEPQKYSFGVFAKTFEKDSRKRTIHVDTSDWTALIYLSRPEDCSGGTVFYENKDFGWSLIPDEETLKQSGFESRDEFKTKYMKSHQTDDSWKVSARVGMKFNRMLLFKAGDLFHAAEGYFGTNDENCRLIQLFFFKTWKEA